MLRPAATIVAAALLITTAPAAAQTVPPGAVPFDAVQGGAVPVSITIQGAGPFRFVLDTGSTASLIGEPLVRRLGAPLVAQAPVTTASGTSMQGIAEVRQVLCGGARAEWLHPSVLTAEALAALVPGVDGILGQDFLRGRVFTLDYRRGLLLWGMEGAATAVDLPLALHDGRWLVEVRQPDGRVVTLVPDTGSERLVLFSRNGRRPLAVQQAPGLAGGALRTMNGQTGVQAVVVPRLALGPLTLRDQAAVLVARDEPAGPAADGLLPLHRFSRVTFRTDAGLLVVEP